MKAIAGHSKAIQGLGRRLGEQQIRDLQRISHSAEEFIQAAPMALGYNNKTTQQTLLKV